MLENQKAIGIGKCYLSSHLGPHQAEVLDCMRFQHVSQHLAIRLCHDKLQIKFDKLTWTPVKQEEAKVFFSVTSWQEGGGGDSKEYNFTDNLSHDFVLASGACSKHSITNL